MKTKIWLISAALLILAGLIIFVGVMTVLKWDFTKISTSRFETKEMEINDSFTNISIATKTANVAFMPTDREKPYVILYEQKNLGHVLSINDNTLTVEIKDTRKWYEYIGINFKEPKITVYLPNSSYGLCTVKTSTGDVEIPKSFTFESLDVSGSTGNINCSASVTGAIKIKLSTGDINLENISAASLDLTVSTGKINVSGVNCSGDIKTKVSTGKMSLTDVTCKSLTSDGDTGDTYFKNVIATEKFDIKRDTGDVNFERCDAAEIFVTTDTGDVKGTLLTEKVFFPRSNTGKTETPKTITGGVCEITTDTGDIVISVVSQ